MVLAVKGIEEPGPCGVGRENCQHGGEAKPLLVMTSPELCPCELFKHFSVSRCTADMEGSVAECVLVFCTTVFSSPPL